MGDVGKCLESGMKSYLMAQCAPGPSGAYKEVGRYKVLNGHI